LLHCTEIKYSHTKFVFTSRSKNINQAAKISRLRINPEDIWQNH
jgi:hypothetical protein